MATGIGETLRAARRQQGVALADAAAETRVRESYLAALEEEDFAALGGDVYVKGFLRSYARFLRLDPDPLLATYRAEYERGTDEVGPLAQAPAYPVASERRPGLLVWAGAAGFILVLFFLIGLFNREEAEPPPAAAPSPVATEPAAVAEDPGEDDEATEAATEAEEATEAPDATDDPTEFLAADGVELSLDVSGGDSWMRVIVDGVTEFEGLQSQGSTAEYVAEESITVRLGDAGAVQVTVNGQNRGTLGGPAEVVTKTFTAEDAA